MLMQTKPEPMPALSVACFGSNDPATQAAVRETYLRHARDWLQEQRERDAAERLALRVCDRLVERTLTHEAVALLLDGPPVSFRARLLAALRVLFPSTA